MLSHERALGIARLLQETWPAHVDSAAKLAEALMVVRPDKPDSVFYARWDGERVIASAQTFARTIYFSSECQTILALAGVCVDPDYRGRGLGAEIVRRAWKPVDEGRFSLSLFQTGAPGFYERLGARLVDNRFVNRLTAESNVSPWWDPHVMIYPADADWPTARIDLNGPGY